MSVSESLREVAEAWRADDPDPVTSQEVTALLAEGDAAALHDRFDRGLEFGTAGLRGLLGAGPNRMNRKVVIRATAGLCAYVLATTPDAKERGVCIGFDGRRMSREFAADAAAVCNALGLPVRTFDHVVPTPVLGYACLVTKAAAGIMVTASHNPPAYNGYKVFAGNGAQIIPPADEGIAAAIDALGGLDTIGRMDADAAREAGLLSLFDETLERRYLDGVRSLMIHPGLPRDLSIAYTALHGVGDRLARKALDEAGFSKVHSVAEQAEPDGAFPTVEFPNPEEKGAMDLVLALGREVGADLVLANDPDADRLAVAVRDDDGGYVQLTGNDVGCLLGHYLLDQGPAGDQRLVINTIVSSPMLGSIATAHRAHFEQVLTGFKWIANTALRLEGEGPSRFVFGYEEALGYTVGSLVRDKDGIGTAVVVADMAAWCRSQGRSLLDELELAWRRYGMYLSRQVSRVLPGADGAAQIADIMARVRTSPPTSLGAFAVTAFMDLSTGVRRAADGAETPLGLPPGDVLAMEVEGGHRVMLRPSGTEPKIKFYFDARVDMTDNETADAARARGDALLDELVTGLAAVTDPG
ncbi:MAG: phospho-sugar mutase [Sandaracinaceae bacterium]|nr:phospho-sugar mutase [Sandaracinaceae bacterium]